MTSTRFARRLRAGSALSTAALLAFGVAAAPAFAQSTSPDDAAAGQEIVVTGSLFKKSDVQTAAPLTSVTAAQLDARGINNVQEAVQRLSANGAGALPNNFSAGGAFAAGASAVSLRGLGTSSTLVLFDGLRASYYPLADDGTRNFVDLNTIPDAITERIDVLKEGASSTYGADAVAGVVNVILKKEIKGFHGNVSGGISQRGDAGEQRADATYGHGDVQEDGYNFYINGEYQHNAALYSRDRGYPYNTGDFTRLCGTSRLNGALTCRNTAVVNGLQFDGTASALGTTIVPIFRPYNAAGTAPVAGSRYSYAPGASCGTYNLPTQTLTAAQLAATSGAASPLAGVCLQDTRYLFNQIAPEQTRIGGTAHLTVRVGDNAKAYASFTYYQSKVNYLSGSPRSLTVATSAVASASNPIPSSVTLSALVLPVYVCAAGVGTIVNGINVSSGCTAANGTLNPSNPFANTANPSPARLVGLLNDIPYGSTQFSKTYRGATGITGTFGGDWGYDVGFVAMRTDLRSVTTGVPNLQRVITAAAQGTYNFINTALNTAAQRQFIAPDAVGKFNSQMYQGQATLTKSLFELPGGPFQAAVGGAARYESVYAPSRNPFNANPADRSSLNAFGAVGHRDVESGFFELNAPIIEQIEINGSGRYDHYSSGQSNFSPKIGAVLKPIKQITFFGNYSKGFRIGSFAETGGSPTTGFVTADAPSAFQAAYGNNGTGVGYSLGLTTVSNPNLKPEKSTNITLGATVSPTPWLSIKADYYDIKKKGGITFPNYKPIVAQYFATPQGTITPGQSISYAGGWTVVAGPAVTTGCTLAACNPLPAYVVHSLDNASSIKTSGIDVGFDIHLPIGPKLKFYSNLDATYVIKSVKTNADGSVERYDGSLGPYQITSASGTPKWRGSIQNTFEYGNFSLSGTVYYTDGYRETAEDNGGLYNDDTCLSGVGTGTPAVYRDGATPIVCKVKAFWDVDLTTSLKVTKNMKVYLNVLNLFDTKAPYDPTTYGGSNYNPAWASAGIMGRYIRIGAKLDL